MLLLNKEGSTNKLCCWIGQIKYLLTFGGILKHEHGSQAVFLLRNMTGHKNNQLFFPSKKKSRKIISWHFKPCIPHHRQNIFYVDARQKRELHTLTN